MDLLWADSRGTDILGSAPPLSPSGKMGWLHFTPLTFSIVGGEEGRSEIPNPSLPQAIKNQEVLNAAEVV